MKYLGLDVGKKNIGVAVGEVIAKELTTIRAQAGQDFYSNPQLVVPKLKQLIETEQVDALIIGLPVKENGSPSEESSKIKAFATHLETEFGLGVRFVNETLTSFMARDILEGEGASKQETDQRIDQLSAELILQQYLEEHANL